MVDYKIVPIQTEHFQYISLKCARNQDTPLDVYVAEAGCLGAHDISDLNIGVVVIIAQGVFKGDVGEVEWIWHA